MNATEAQVGYLVPEWAVSPRVKAAFSLRSGGVSEGGYRGLNLGLHVGDCAERVNENRQRLQSTLTLPAAPMWLDQVHGVEVLRVSAGFQPHAIERPVADAAVTTDSAVVLAIQVADCLPVLLAAEDGRVIGAAHAGWRGLAQGVIEAALAAMRAADPTLEPSAIHAWLGPCIGVTQFEVGGEVREAFLQAGDPPEAFMPNAQGRWQADLLALARHRLQRAGVVAISGGQWCTASQPELFFSHRRESRQGNQSGRMAALLWLHDPR